MATLSSFAATVKLAAAFCMVVGPMTTCEARRENAYQAKFLKESVSAPGEVIGGAKSQIKRQRNPDYYWLKFRFVSADGKSHEARCEVTPGLFNAHMRDGTVTKVQTKVHYLADDPSGSALLEKPHGDARNIWGGVALFVIGCGLLISTFIYDLLKRPAMPLAV